MGWEMHKNKDRISDKGRRERLGVATCDGVTGESRRISDTLNTAVIYFNEDNIWRLLRALQPVAVQVF